MSNFRDVWGGFLIMVVFCLTGAVMALSGGIVYDHMHSHMDGMGWFDDAPDTWTEGGTWSNLITTMNLWYGLCMLFPIVGIAAFFKSVIARQGYDQYLEY